jgi:diguanylate cyclase (GGDEF)-like protein
MDDRQLRPRQSREGRDPTMLSLHAPTLLLTLVMVALATGVLHLLSSRQNRSEAALVYWGLSNLMAALALGLLGTRQVWADRLSIDVANAALYFSYMLSFAGMRRFCGKPVWWPLLLVPSLVWLALCQGPVFYASLEARMAVNSLFSGVIWMMTAYTLWSYRAEPLASRAPTYIWLTLHASIFLLRVPLLLHLGVPKGVDLFTSPLMSLTLIEGLIHITIISFLQMSLTKDRAENRYRLTAETDMLTGLANRRAFFDQSEAKLAEARRTLRPASVLLIDVDRFKAINDTYGHAGGDAVLVALARTISQHLRPNEVFGRLGGEEFGCLLPETPLGTASIIAEGLRARIAGLEIRNGDDVIRVSVSIGVSATTSTPGGLDRLLADADAGLYQAKRDGRDRVVTAPVKLLKAG